MLFAILKQQGKARCLECDHVIVGGLYDEDLGGMFACRQEACIYEKKSIEMGMCGDEAVKLRLLRR